MLLWYSVSIPCLWVRSCTQQHTEVKGKGGGAMEGELGAMEGEVHEVP